MFVYLDVPEMHSITLKNLQARRIKLQKQPIFGTELFINVKTKNTFKCENYIRVPKMFEMQTIQLTENGLKLGKSKSLTFYRCKSTKIVNQSYRHSKYMYHKMQYISIRACDKNKLVLKIFCFRSYTWILPIGVDVMVRDNGLS